MCVCGIIKNDTHKNLLHLLVSSGSVIVTVSNNININDWLHFINHFVMSHMIKSSGSDNADVCDQRIYLFNRGVELFSIVIVYVNELIQINKCFC